MSTTETTSSVIPSTNWAATPSLSRTREMTAI